MSVLQVTDRFQLPNEALDSAQRLIEHRQSQARERFASELYETLKERGGIVGPIHDDIAQEPAWSLFEGDGVTFRQRIYARVESLPEPTQYRLMGGPADGFIAHTRGERTWRVPVMPPLSAAVAADPWDVPVTALPEYAEYERQGDTQVYLYRGMAK